MALLKIARMGHPVLAGRAGEVADPTAPEVRQLVEDMIETMHDAGGVGLAAPQVHVPLRIVVFMPPDAPEDEPILALVNPRHEILTDERVEGWEGCLSLPGLQGLVPRAPRVSYAGTTPDGVGVSRTVDGYHAVVVQHEFDHLDGILYPQRMTDIRHLIFTSERHWRADEDES